VHEQRPLASLVDGDHRHREVRLRLLARERLLERLGPGAHPLEAGTLPGTGRPVRSEERSQVVERHSY
jgi:hypothetical protein